MNIDLKGKKVLIGGASGGIGKGIAVVLANAGAEVYLMARNEEKIKNVISLLDKSNGQNHGYIITDFNDFSAHKENVANFFKNNSIDILVNNTNGPQAGDVMSKDLEDYQDAFNLLFQNAVFTSKLALLHMQKQGFGRIINVSSLTVKEPQDSLVLSNSMRIALVSWSKSLSVAVAKDGITVNSIFTGYFDTERLNSLMENQAQREGISFQEVLEKRKESVPVKRLGKPEEYGYLVAFLSSEYASFITGAGIPLDGGISKIVF